MRIILFVATLLIFIGCALSQFPIGNQVFYANVLNTNAAYGSGASFPCSVWFNGNLGLMRIDYRNPITNQVFMNVFYNYTSHDKYEICGTTCARATWNAPAPIFYGTAATYSAPAACITPDYPGPRACVSNCRTYVSNPNQPQGISSLSYNDTSGPGVNLCLVRWTVQSGQTYGPEWQIEQYYTSSYPAADPNLPATYSIVLAGVTCPQPSCSTVLDLSIICDESGSIWDANAWGPVQDFVLNLISSFNLAPDQVRAGLAYFSGQDSCSYNWTGTAGSYTPACGGSCAYCGGRWDNLTPSGLVTDKAGLYALAYSHNIAKGYTCISCGLDLGIQMLNIAPKANVQKLIILFTDGAQNRVTNNLAYEGALASSFGIKVIAVATGLYKLSDLQVFTNSIYTSTTYTGLSSLISSIVSPLCQPLANIDTCDFCSGLCSCTTTCNCPNCNDYNLCTNDICDIQTTLGQCVHTNVICDDNNPCTVNNCYPASGCDYSTPTPEPTGPPTDNYCNRWVCSNPQGYLPFIDVGTGLCPQGASLCVINYCNSTIGTTGAYAGSCVTKNLATDIPYGQTYTYTTSAGLTKTAIGCARPLGALPCYNYICNPNNGTCSLSIATCACTTNANCDDGNGCTVDVCDTNLNQCNHTQQDCWSQISQGVCKNGQTGAPSNATGYSYWAGTGGTFPLNGTLPVYGNYNCDQLACYGGQRSTYTCVSNPGGETYQCQRQTVPCTSSGCVDNICESLGTWTNSQYNTNCGAPITRVCNDGNACTSDACKSSFTGTSCTNTTCPTNTNRCTFTDISSSCNTGNACILGSCLPASGCTTQNLSIPPNTTCYYYTCDKVQGIVQNVIPTACTNANKCIVSYCNTTANATFGACETWDKSMNLQTASITFTDQYGVLQTDYGCLNTTALSLNCLTASCNTTTGACYINTNGCVCTSSIQCDDQNGCTNDTCTGSACVYTPVDCWAAFSNGGGCSLSSTPVADTTVGMTNYNQGSPTNPFNVTGSYNCNQLACYSGLRNQYICQSLSSSTHQCNRVTSTCPKGGCLDTICQTLGTLTNNNFDTNCGNTVVPPCMSNGCNIETCNNAFSYVYAAPGQNNLNAPNKGEVRCNVVSNGTNCNLANLCQTNQCSNITGCYTTNTTNPFTTNFCFNTFCNGTTSGWLQTNNGNAACPAVTNLCQTNYCNTTANNGQGACVIVDRGSIPIGGTQFYTDSDGLTKSVTGCADPVSNDLFTCRKYGCDGNTGLCTIDITNCQCLTNTACQDGNGCTIDSCIPPGVCQRTVIDCFQYFSNGTCVQNVNFAYDNTTGLNLYYGSDTANSKKYSLVDANGYPSPAQGVVRTCAELACYNGAPSNYTCFSLAEGSYTCQRSFLNCSRNGCQDNICQSLGTWNVNNQMDSNCGVIYRPICVSNNACTVNFCDITWTPQSTTPRCIHQSINATSYCDDGNFCTQDYCDSQDTSGNVCKHNLYSDSYIRKYICKKAKVCQSVQCTVNKCIYSYIGCTAPSLCIFFVCNGSTNGTCKAYPTGVYSIDACGVCAGNGLSCLPTSPGNPKKTSIAVALGVGLGIGLFAAAIIIGILTKKSYEFYLAVGTESLGTVTHAPTYQGAEHHLDTNQYHND